MAFSTNKHWFKSALSVALLAVMAIWLAACGTASNSGESGGNGAASQTPAVGEGQTGGGETRMIKHAMGETAVPVNPQKVVILTNEGTEALLALGIKPIAAVKSFTGDPWYDHIKDEMEGVQVVGVESQPNLELIASLKPDLIIGNKLRQEKVYDQLNAIAPTVFSETLRGEWKTNFKLYADALNKKEQGDQIIAAFDKRVEDFKAKAGDKLKQKVSVVRFMAGKTRIYYKDSFSGVIFEQIGIARQDYKGKDMFMEEIPKERLPEVDADLLFYFTYETGDGKGEQQESEFLNDPLWKNLNVVKNNKAFKVSDVIWNTAGGVKAANLMLDELAGFYDIKL